MKYNVAYSGRCNSPVEASSVYANVNDANILTFSEFASKTFQTKTCKDAYLKSTLSQKDNMSLTDNYLK